MVVALLQIRKEVAWHENLSDQNLPHSLYDMKIHVCINNNENRELLLSQLKSFPNGKHDDLVDAISYGYLYLKEFGDSHVATAGKRKRRRL